MDSSLPASINQAKLGLPRDTPPHASRPPQLLYLYFYWAGFSDPSVLVGQAQIVLHHGLEEIKGPLFSAGMEATLYCPLPVLLTHVGDCGAFVLCTKCLTLRILVHIHWRIPADLYTQAPIWSVWCLHNHVTPHGHRYIHRHLPHIEGYSHAYKQRRAVIIM